MARARLAWVLALVLASSAACSAASTGDSVTSGDAHGAGHHAVLTSQPAVFVPANIDFTGKTDVTKPLQTFIDSVNDGSDIVFHKNGRYRVEGTLFVTDKTNVTFDGQNATVYATTRGTLERSQFWITEGGGLVFRNLIVKGANPFAGIGEKAYNPALEKQHGFRIEGVDGIELSHVTVTDVYGDFVYVARYASDQSTNVWIHDSKFARNGRQGVSLIAATGVIIERNSFTDTRRGTIDLEPNGPNQSVTDVFILNNTIGEGRLFFIASHGKGPVNDIVVTGNKLHQHVMSIDVVPPAGERRQNWIITNNTSDTVSAQRPIRFINTDGLQVTGNRQPMSSKLPGVEITDTCGVKVLNNVFGTGPALLQHGATCPFTLQVPTQPLIPGRA